VRGGPLTLVRCTSVSSLELSGVRVVAVIPYVGGYGSVIVVHCLCLDVKMNTTMA